MIGLAKESAIDDFIPRFYDLAFLHFEWFYRLEARLAFGLCKLDQQYLRQLMISSIGDTEMLQTSYQSGTPSHFLNWRFENAVDLAIWLHFSIGDVEMQWICRSDAKVQETLDS